VEAPGQLPSLPFPLNPALRSHACPTTALKIMNYSANTVVAVLWPMFISAETKTTPTDDWRSLVASSISSSNNRHHQLRQ